MLKNKIKYSFLFFFTGIISTINAQQIFIETGFESANFKNYVNNLGENTLDVNYTKSQEIFIEGGFRFNLRKNRLKCDVALSYNKYKINTGFYSGKISIPLTYNLNYVALKTGINFAIINELDFKLQVHGHISYDWLIAGTSSYKNVVNDLYRENTFDRTLLRYHRGISAEYIISNKISAYINYNVADSFKDKNEDSNIEEKYSLHTNAFSIGLLFNIQTTR
ncbi:hypothetical protein SHK09_05150 [Polaribacter sp. PL03]|uniref:hypothetical protein n=1 Tax=Polaribacter sp. PL03 TaxID=3088353 RepID=UPI0029D062B4|nr:hypothetical protein [Polaribacter sp. PL03]MDX6746171.1 hypothetical protein [Polaribacter sp. PL03]